MRRLLYVPIIHDEADLGRAATALTQRSVALAGERRWAIHQETVDRFWASLAAYFGPFAPGQLRVYQDGLPAGGEVGRRIVEEAARRGSKNYLLVLDLLVRGAELRKTEDPSLLLQERDNLLEIAADEAGGKRRDTERYLRQRDRLMEERDRFIAENINATLKEGEIGVLFVGSFHCVASRLAEDIAIENIKDPARLRAYFRELFEGWDEDRLEELARYVASPVDAA